MERNSLISLMSAYGFVLEFEEKHEHKMRFGKDDRNGFIDIWQGKKGMTIGVYNPESRSMFYRRNGNISLLEKELINYGKYGKDN